MDHIPAEIKLAIVRQLLDVSPESAHTYATVSREWQRFIEPTTFASLKLDQGRLGQARETLTPTRQTYVRKIQFTALLPDYHDLKELEESDSEKKENNEAFSDAVTSLMEFLSTWSSAHNGGIELELCAACTIDLQGYNGGMEKALWILNRRERRERCVLSYVALNDGLYHQLPELSLVRKFTCPPASVTHRRLVPRTCCEIASRFPRLRSIDWNLRDGSHDYSFRLQLRNDFAIGLSALPESIRHFTLSYVGDTTSFGHFIDDPDPLIYPGATRDPLSVALRKVSIQMEDVSLYMVAGSELLWDSDLHPNQQGHWPLLRKIELRLNVNNRTPQGEALFDFDPLEPDYDPSPGPRIASDRVVPIPAQLTPYQLALARAAGRMPNLTSLWVTIGDRIGDFITYTVEPTSGADQGSRAEFIYEGSSATTDTITQEIQEEWWNTAHVHLREGAEFHFKVVDDGRLLELRHKRDNPGRGLPQDLPEQNTIEWTRVI
ncbi:hypothetical protein PG999_000132 [Apiospora kogelbergensis]|uniref:F-box domain-containing protein n=1 Tax=Apiospora kogelbergensis TaxID=1337665 RepID=A0AAW0RB23_9PEZI